MSSEEIPIGEQADAADEFMRGLLDAVRCPRTSQYASTKTRCSSTWKATTWAFSSVPRAQPSEQSRTSSAPSFNGVPTVTAHEYH